MLNMCASCACASEWTCHRAIVHVRVLCDEPPSLPTQLRAIRWRTLRDMIVMVRAMGKPGMSRLDALFDRLSASKDGLSSLAYFTMQFATFLAADGVKTERTIHTLFASFDLTGRGRVDVRDMQCGFRWVGVCVCACVPVE